MTKGIGIEDAIALWQSGHAAYGRSIGNAW
jgi:hypothetical protein